MLPDRTGVFRFRALEIGVGKSRENGYPQANVRLYLTEWYNQETREWLVCEDSQFEYTGYFILFYKDKKQNMVPSFNHKAMMDVFGWDGRSFAGLAEIDPATVTGQIKLEANDPEYADKNPFKAVYIAKYDADPNSQLSKLDKKDIADLDKEFAALLKQTGTKKAAATLPTVAPTAKPLPTMPPVVDKIPVAPPVAEPEVKDEIDSILTEPTTGAVESPAARRGRPAKAKGPSLPPAPPAKSTPPAPPAAAVEFTKQMAWDAIQELRHKDATDEAVVNAWNDAVAKHTENKTEDQMPGYEWLLVKEEVLNKVGVF